MGFKVTVPKDAQALDECKVMMCYVSSGDYVAAGEVICEISTDFGSMEITTEKAGAITFAVSEGDGVQAKDLVATIDTSAKKPVIGTNIPINDHASEAEEDPLIPMEIEIVDSPLLSFETLAIVEEDKLLRLAEKMPITKGSKVRVIIEYRED